MSWIHSQRTGNMFHNGKFFAIGYSGRDNGKNNPAMQHVYGTGPLPCGLYTIGDSYLHPELGPITMDLTPDEANQMFGRDKFRIHGDSEKHPGEASHGCIVQGHVARVEIAKWVRAGDRTLEVVAEDPV